MIFVFHGFAKDSTFGSGYVYYFRNAAELCKCFGAYLWRLLDLSSDQEILCCLTCSKCRLSDFS